MKSAKAKRQPLNAGKIERLLQQHVARRDRGKALYKSADAALDKLLALDPVLDQAIDVRFRQGKNVITRRLVVKNLFKDTNTVFKSVSAHQFAVEEWKEPKPAKKIAAPAEAGAAPHE